MVTGRTIAILGAGTGGIVAADLLRASLPEPHRILLLNRGTTFYLGTTKSWVMVGLEDPVRAIWSLDVLSERGIELIQAEVQRIDVERRSVTTSSRTVGFDFLVVALGADMNMGLVPGLAEAAETFYSMEGAARLRTILERFDGGKIVLLVPRTPFKCPPGPYEGAMLLHAFLEERGLLERSHISVWSIEKAPMATAGPEAGTFIKEQLAARGIEFHGQMPVDHVADESKTITFEDGTVVSYDLLIAIPPHEAPRAVRESGLAKAGAWIPVDPLALEIEGAKERRRSFAIGDVTTITLPGRFHPDVPLSLPKAGTFAERQAHAVCASITAEVTGTPPGAAYDGTGFCFIEMGRNAAVRGDGSFYDSPRPRMVFRQPDGDQVQEKRNWVSQWMAKYL